MSIDASDLTLIGGLLLGFASSLHCAGMCGGIASSLMLAFDRQGSRWSQVKVLLTMQLARVFAYITAGAFLGALGSEFYGAFNHAEAHGVMRWAATASLGWIGLSMVGFAPSLSLLDRLVAPVSHILVRPGRMASRGGVAGQILSGFVWGFLPCGMVYGALFYAMLAGSGSAGALVMTGFGIGTIPSVAGTALGISALRRMAVVPKIRVVAGIAIISIALITALIPATSWEALCA